MSRLRIRTLAFSDIPVLQAWAQSSDYQLVVEHSRMPPDVFANFVWDDVTHGRRVQFVAETKDGAIAGTSWLYKIDRRNDLACLSVYLPPGRTGSGLGLMLGIHALLEAFGRLALNKVCIEVAEFSVLSMRTVTHAIDAFGFEFEGRFREHRKVQGRRWDVSRFAVFRRSVDELAHFADNYAQRSAG